jgi:hypothetical protein
MVFRRRFAWRGRLSTKLTAYRRVTRAGVTKTKGSVWPADILNSGRHRHSMSTDSRCAAFIHSGAALRYRPLCRALNGPRCPVCLSRPSTPVFAIQGVVRPSNRLEDAGSDLSTPGREGRHDRRGDSERGRITTTQPSRRRFWVRLASVDTQNRHLIDT